MKPEIHAYLDGEVRFEDLSPELQDEARRWDGLLAETEPATGAGLAPSWVESAVMAEVLAESAHTDPPRRGGFLDWLIRPRSVSISPLLGGLSLAGIALLMTMIASPRQGGRGTDGEGAQRVLVQFVLEAPAARSVSVAGDFNEWGEDGLLTDVDGDGVWTGRIEVEPGVHEYMFVIDGTEWVTDPGAESYRDDGFGSRNAVLTVQSTI